MADIKDCSTCRFHSKQTQEAPMWFEEDGEKLRTTDVVVYVCMSTASPNHGKGVVDPILCDGYLAGTHTTLPDELKTKLDAAMERFRGRR